MQEPNSSVEMSASLKSLLNELNKPETANALKNIAKNAQVLELLVESADGLFRRGEEITDNIGESIREFTPSSNGNGHSVMDEVPQLVENLPTLAKTGNRLSDIAKTEAFENLLTESNVESLGQLADALGDPETIEALKKVAEFAPMLVFLLEAVDGFLRRGHEITDNIGESIREFSPSGDSEVNSALSELPQLIPPLIEHLPNMAQNLPPLLEQAPSLMDTTSKLGKIAESEGVQTFLNSEMLTPSLVSFLGETGKVAAETREEFQKNPKEVTLWGAYKESKDEDIQRGLGFLLALAKNIGKSMK